MMVRRGWVGLKVVRYEAVLMETNDGIFGLSSCLEDLLYREENNNNKKTHTI